MVSARLRRIGVPELLDQPVGGDHLPTANQQQGQEQANPSSAQVEERPLPDHLEGPQDAEFHRCLPVSLVLPRQGWPRDQSAIGPRSQPRTIGGDHSHHTSRKETSMAHPDSATTGTQQHEHRALEGMEELYVREADRLEAINGPFGEAMLDVARLQPSERVLDVGCGQGIITAQGSPGRGARWNGGRRRHQRPAGCARAPAGRGGRRRQRRVHPRRRAGASLPRTRLRRGDQPVRDRVLPRPRGSIRQPRPRDPARRPAGHRVSERPPQDRVGRRGVRRRSPPRGDPRISALQAHPARSRSPTATDCGGFSRPAASTRSRSRP
jgi:hypothetical protein